MDKEWVTLNRLSPQFHRGLKCFISNSLKVASDDGCIKCPCRECCNRVWEEPSEVWEHLTVYGMDPLYQNVPWVFHGETIRERHTPTHESMPSVDTPDCDMFDMLNDVFRHGCNDRNNEVEDEQYQSSEPTPDAEKFYNLLKEADRDLYPGCHVMKKLDFLVHLYKIKCLYGIPDVGISAILKLIKKILPEGETLPKSFHLTRKLIRELGLTYEKIHACPNDGMLYRKEYASFTSCPSCGESRFCSDKVMESQSSKFMVPQKVLRYFPLGPRLQRLYMSKHTSELMTWHATNRSQDSSLRHPVDSPAWKHVDNKFPSFGHEMRNVRLGLAIDGFNPFGMMSNSHSTWPVVMSVYNSPPWLCMKQPYLMLSLLIPGPREPGNDIDVYLEPLVDELKSLWEDGITAYDEFRKQQFTLRAVVLWTISDFPAYANLSGWSTKGKLACPRCNHGTCSNWLYNGHKHCYMGHRRFLPITHRFRKQSNVFNDREEFRHAPIPMTGTECLAELCTLKFTFGKAAKKRKAHNLITGETYVGPWKKKSIFFNLPYWQHLLIRHNLDVMHIEKNVCDSLVGTILSIDGKTKDGINTRLDMVDLDIKKYQHPVTEGNKTRLPPALYTMSNTEKTLFCQVLANVRVPDGFSSNVARCVKVKEKKLVGLKSHDFHVIMQQLLPLAIRNTLPQSVAEVILELCGFFRHLCSKSSSSESFSSLNGKIITILCELERFFPPAFFDVMVHLTVHLSDEASIAGPVHYRWMYPIERYLGTLKKYVRNHSKPEGSMAEGCIVNECINLCSMYLSDTETRINRQGRNTDGGGRNVKGGIPIFAKPGSPLGKGGGKVCLLTKEERDLAHKYVLFNCAEVKKYVDEHVAAARAIRGRRITTLESQRAAHKSFPEWFAKHVDEMDINHEDIVSEDIRALSHGPSEWCVRHKKYIVNGCRFRIKSMDNNKKNQNSGIFLTSEATCYATTRDRNPVDGQVDYYGVLTDIIELQYNAGRKIVLFKGDWVDGVTRNRGVRKDKYGFTLVNFKRLLPENDPFILASQAMQVFYVQDPVEEDWHVAVKTRPRDWYDLDIVNEHDPCAEQDLANREDITYDCNVRDDIDSLVIRRLVATVLNDNVCPTNCYMGADDNCGT